MTGTSTAATTASETLTLSASLTCTHPTIVPADAEPIQCCRHSCPM